MNRKTALSLLIAAAAGSVFADDITIDPPFTSTMSREQVQEELRQFRQSGVDPWSDSYDQLATFQSTRNREDVTRDFIEAREAVAASHGEDGGALYMARQQQPASPVATELAGMTGDADE